MGLDDNGGKSFTKNDGNGRPLGVNWTYSFDTVWSYRWIIPKVSLDSIGEAY